MYNNVFLVLLNRGLLQSLLLMTGSIFITPGKGDPALRKLGRLYLICFFKVHLYFIGSSYLRNVFVINGSVTYEA